jgi:hypothetical protein
VKLEAGMRWSSEADAAEDADFHPEVAAIFLGHQVGGSLGSPEGFFRVITERKILDKLAESYPSPRERHDVPLWVYMASNLPMRFHGKHHFHAFPFLARSSSMIEPFGPSIGHKATHPETGDISLRCAGFNDKNEYDRQTACDQGYLRKLAIPMPSCCRPGSTARSWQSLSSTPRSMQKDLYWRRELSVRARQRELLGSSRLLFDEQNHPSIPRS